MELVTKTRLQERGQITIPYKARDWLHLKPGEDLILMITEEEIIIRPEVVNPIEMAGMLGKDEKTKRVKDLIAKYKGFE